MVSFSGVKEENLIHYKFPNPEEFDEANIQIIYMGWFWKDWSLMNNGMFSITNGIEVRDQSVLETGDFNKGNFRRRLGNFKSND